MSLAFDFIWALLLLPLPGLVRRLPPARLESAALWVPFFARCRPATDDPAGQGRVRKRAIIAWVALVIAASQPQLALGAADWALYRPFLLLALMTAMSAGLAITRAPRRLRRLPDRYHRDESP